MTDLAERIRRLDDATAERILRVVAGHRLESQLAQRVEADPPTAAALTDAAGLAPDPATAGEVARTALLLIAEDPADRPAVEHMVAHPPPESAEVFADPLTVVAVSTAALVVLQSYVKVEKVPGKGWTFKLEKKPMENSLLRLFIQKLVGFLPNRGA
jgi:hypothetical protein